MNNRTHKVLENSSSIDWINKFDQINDQYIANANFDLILSKEASEQKFEISVIGRFINNHYWRHNIIPCEKHQKIIDQFKENFPNRMDWEDGLQLLKDKYNALITKKSV